MKNNSKLLCHGDHVDRTPHDAGIDCFRMAYKKNLAIHVKFDKNTSITDTIWIRGMKDRIALIGGKLKHILIPTLVP